MMKANKIYTTIVFLLFTITVKAQDTKSQFNPIEHAVVSQTIAPDARAAGMGDVGAATDPDVNSQYWNPAKYIRYSHPKLQPGLWSCKITELIHRNNRLHQPNTYYPD